MKEGYPFNRALSLDQILERLGCNPVELASYLARKVNESPRIGELGGGTGELTQYMLSCNQHLRTHVRVHNIDMYPAKYALEHFSKGKYPDEVRFTHCPHLIIAHNSVAAFEVTNSNFPFYIDFKAAIGPMISEVHPDVGTIVIYSVMPVQVSLATYFRYAKQNGFTIYVPVKEDVLGYPLKIVLSKDKKIDPWFMEKIRVSAALDRQRRYEVE